MHVTFGVLLSFFLAEPDAIDGINQRQASIAAAQAEAPLVGLAVCLSPFLPSLAPLPLPFCSAPPSVFGIDHTSAAFYSCGCPQPPPFSQHSRLYLSTRGTWAAPISQFFSLCIQCQRNAEKMRLNTKRKRAALSFVTRNFPFSVGLSAAIRLDRA